MKFIERKTDELDKELKSDSEQIKSFRIRMYYLAILLETCPKKKPYDRLLMEYIDGTALKNVKSSLFGEKSY